MTTAFGWAFFGGFVATVMSVSGLLLSFLGVLLFGAVSLQRSRKAEAAATAAATAASAKAASIGDGSSSGTATDGEVSSDTVTDLTIPGAITRQGGGSGVGTDEASSSPITSAGGAHHPLSGASGLGGTPQARVRTPTSATAAASVDDEDEDEEAGDRRPLVPRG